MHHGTDKKLHNNEPGNYDSKRLTAKITTAIRRNNVSAFDYQMVFCIFIGLFFLFDGVPTAKVRRREVLLGSTTSTTTPRDDLLCNLGDEHECVCNRSRGNLDSSSHTACHRFLKEKRLEAVSIVLRDINLRTILHTNETYEQYLRRRIAHILSQYCDNMPKECPGTLAEIRTQQSNKKSSLVEVNDKTTEIIHDDPVFTRENVIILRVIYLPGRSRIEVTFVVIKRAKTIGLNAATIFDPITVKYILSAQLAPLSRVLGGIRIEQFSIDFVEKPMEPVNNTKLLIMIGVIGASMAFCCTIAIVRQLCISLQTRRETCQNQEDNKALEKKNIRNYGSCTDKFFPHFDLSNGHTKSKSKAVCSRDSSVKKRMKGRKASKNSADPSTTVEVDNRALTNEEVSPRPFQNIFICDHSQLPKEGDEEFELEIQRIKHKLSVRSPRSPFSSDEDASGAGFHGFHYPTGPFGNERRPSITENIPSVVLVEGPGSPVNRNERDNLMEGAKGGGFLSAISEDHPFERPLSRRGSITDEGPQEDGEEEAYNDTREDTPVPLGDDQNAGTAVERPLIDVVLRKKKTEKKTGEKMVLSESESEDEEAEAALYRPLREERENTKNFGRRDPMGRMMSSSESEGTDNKKEMDMLERHQYERLLESPMPQNEQQQENGKSPKIISSDQM